MALGSDILNLLVKADASGAVKEFQKLGREIDDSADKAATGFKGKIAGAFDSLQSKSPMVAGIFDKIGLSSSQAAGVIATSIPFAVAAAGGAVAKFALDGAGKFASLGLAVDRFATSSGLSLDSASRWVEVAGDLGVSTDTISGAFGRMEKAIGTNRSAFGDLVKTSKDGSVDMSATFLAVITHLQGIKDPIDRATESSKLFGRGFAGLAEIIGMNAADVQKRLEGVADVKVFTPEKEAQVKAYRDATNDLKDKVEELQLSLGSKLVPALANVAGAAAGAVDWINKLTDAANSLDNSVGTGQGGLIGKLTGNKGFDSKSWSEFFGIVDGGVKSVGNIKGALDGIDTSKLKAGTVDAGGFGAALAAASGGGISGALSAVGTAIDSVATAAAAGNKALTDYSNAQLAAFDATFAVKDAQDEFAKSLLIATQTANDTSKSAGEVQNAYDDETQAAEKTAVAIQKKAEQDAIASGHALTAAQSNDVLISALQTMSAQASGPTKAALDTLIGTLQTTGQQKPAPTVTLNDKATAPLQTVTTLVHGLDGRVASVTVNADTSSANAKLDALRRRLSAAASTGLLINPGGGGTGVAFAEGGMVPGPKGRPLAATVHGGEYVLPADLVNSIKKGQPPGPSSLPSGSTGGAGQAMVFNISGAVDPYSTARQIQTILAKGGYAGFSAKAA